MGNRVTTPNLRFEFVKGWLTGGTDPADGSVECGPYTAFPLEASLDQIAEIFYRVKSAQFTENTLFVDGISSGVTAGTISPRVMYSDSGGGLSDNYLMSGYWSFDEDPFDIYPAALPYFGDQYTENYWDAISSVTTNFRDIADNEIGLWLPRGETTQQPKWNITSDQLGIVNAFSWYSISATGTVTQPSIPIPWISQFVDPDVIYEQLEMTVAFTGRIGVVYGGFEGEIYHPNNQFFLEMDIIGAMQGAGLYFNAGTIESGYNATDASYTMRLNSGDVSCQLNSTNADLIGEIVHEATEWFPYAKDNPAVPVWDFETGAKL